MSYTRIDIYVYFLYNLLLCVWVIVWLLSVEFYWKKKRFLGRFYMRKIDLFRPIAKHITCDFCYVNPLCYAQHNHSQAVWPVLINQSDWQDRTSFQLLPEVWVPSWLRVPSAATMKVRNFLLRYFFLMCSFYQTTSEKALMQGSRNVKVCQENRDVAKNKKMETRSAEWCMTAEGHTHRVIRLITCGWWWWLNKEHCKTLASATYLIL